MTHASAEYDVLVNILSKLRPIKMILKYSHCIFYTKMSCYLYVMSFSYLSLHTRLKEHCIDGSDRITIHPGDESQELFFKRSMSDRK
jgi:hypothetical protein